MSIHPVFFFIHTAPTAIYTLSLHDALPISTGHDRAVAILNADLDSLSDHRAELGRSEEHTSELQSRFDLVCRLLLEKKNHPHRRIGVLRGDVRPVRHREIGLVVAAYRLLSA